MSSEREATAVVPATEPDAAEEVARGVEVGTRSRWWRRWSLADRLFAITVVAAVVPVAVATARAINRGWIPVGDDAFFTVRARDVFTLEHLPLLGTWSSASLGGAQNLNHPGPLLFDVLALPAKLGGGTGIAIGAAAINVVALLGIAIIGYRRGGAVVGAVAVTVGALLAWSMGSEVLFEPWQPHILLLPFLCFVTLVWAVACGDLVALPWAVGVGSFVVQTHLSYAILVPLVGAWGLVGLALVLRGNRRREPGSWPGLRGRVIRNGVIAAVVFVVCWLQPLIEQFTADGDGNLTRLIRHARDPKVKTVGFDFGIRAVASVVSLPPWWVRPSFGNTFAYKTWRPPSLLLAVGSLLVVAVVLGWCWWGARRHHDRVASRILATAGIVLACALVSAGRTPTTVFGTEPHVYRWVWPVAAFVALAVAVAIVRRLARFSLQITGAFAVVAVVFGVLNLPTSNQGGGPNAQQDAIPAAHDLDRKMGALEQDGPLLIDDLFKVVFADPYGGAIMAELQERGIPFVVQDRGLVRQLGPARRYNGHNARNELLMRLGDSALTAPPGSRLAVRGSGLTAAEQRELSRLRRMIGDYVRAGRLRLNAAGQRAVARGDLPVIGRELRSAAGPDAQAVIDSRELRALVDRHEAVLHGIWADRFERYVTLQHKFDTQTVALFVRPLSSRAASSGSSATR
ncbi:MAG TPA: hypothetical protein VGO28_02645 [Acidimicrobiia bacterium]|jgi:hypothetical protein